MNTTSYTLHELTLGLAASHLGYLCAAPQLVTPAELLVGYAYTAPRLPALHLANGDPGDEPGEDEDLEILLIESMAPLCFADHEAGVRVTLAAGFGVDLRSYFTEDGLIVIERVMLKDLRGDAEQARVDAYLARQP